MNFSFDLNNNLSIISDKVNGTNHTTNYSYDKDNRISGISYDSNNISYTYDTIGRMTNENINTGSTTYPVTFGYIPGINGSSTNKISCITNNGNTINYTYDAGGNILSKTEYPLNNISSATAVHNYSYGDSNWKDKLTAYDGKTITSDSIGNTTSYNGYTFTYEEGRKLTGVTGNGKTISYKYNDSGIRTEKTVNGVTTKYHLIGDKVSLETSGTDTIYYTYSSTGTVMSMNLNGTQYYYLRNAQGDITGLIDKTGAQVVSYIYDSWGKLISIDGTLKDSVGAKNPYRYRGYWYDTETGLYYLNSRYYNPEWGRFINADNLGGRIGKLLSHNAFAYCGNNPVNREDPSGQLWQIVGAVIGAAAGAVIAGAYTDWNWKYMLAGAAAGALVGAGVGYLAEVAYTAIAAGGVAASATGAYNASYSGSAGNGLGKLADKAINVSEKGLNIVKNHISRFGDVAENNAMVNRLETAMTKGNKITGADASFYMHELAESTLMKNGMQYDLAHAASLQKYGVSPFSVYHPDVIRLMPEVFNSSWRNFWGIK